MKKMVDNWILINFCGQKIGQFNSKNIYNDLINILTSQITVLFCIPIHWILIKTETISLPLVIVLVVITFAIIRYFTQEKIPKHYVNDLERKYKALERKRRIINFIIAIILTGASIVLFGLSFWILY